MIRITGSDGTQSYGLLAERNGVGLALRVQAVIDPKHGTMIVLRLRSFWRGDSGNAASLKTEWPSLVFQQADSIRASTTLMSPIPGVVSYETLDAVLTPKWYENMVGVVDKATNSTCLVSPEELKDFIRSELKAELCSTPKTAAEKAFEAMVVAPSAKLN